MRLIDERNGYHRPEQTRPDNRNQNQCQQQGWKGQDDVHHPHDHRIDPTAEITGNDTKRNTADKRDSMVTTRPMNNE